MYRKHKWKSHFCQPLPEASFSQALSHFHKLQSPLTPLLHKHMAWNYANFFLSTNFSRYLIEFFFLQSDFLCLHLIVSKKKKKKTTFIQSSWRKVFPNKTEREYNSNLNFFLGQRWFENFICTWEIEERKWERGAQC